MPDRLQVETHQRGPFGRDDHDDRVGVVFQAHGARMVFKPAGGDAAGAEIGADLSQARVPWSISAEAERVADFRKDLVGIKYHLNQRLPALGEVFTGTVSPGPSGIVLPAEDP